MLRLQAQFPSTVSTVYRCVCMPGVGVGAVGIQLATPGHGQGFSQPMMPLCPVFMTPGQVRSWSKPPGTVVLLVPKALAAFSACAHWTLILLVCAVSLGCSGGGGGAPVSGCWSSTAPEVPSAHFCLQIVPQLLEHRPRISPRCSPQPHQLRHPQHPAVLQGWAGPRAVARGLGPVGGESLP